MKGRLSLCMFKSPHARGLLAALGLILWPTCVGAKAPASDISHPRLTGTWLGEHISEADGIQRWRIERHADGRYESKRIQIKDQPERNDKGEPASPDLLEKNETGTWSSRSGAIFLTQEGGEKPGRVFHYEALGKGCITLTDADPSGKVSHQAMSFAECQTDAGGPLPDKLISECTLQMLDEQMHLVLEIMVGADGKRYASYDGRDDPTTVEVRDYGVRPSFSSALTTAAPSNAGEVQLKQIFTWQGFKPTFDAGAVRVARMYLLVPPRARLPMDHYGGSRVVLMDFSDGSGKRLGQVVINLPVMGMCTPHP